MKRLIMLVMASAVTLALSACGDKAATKIETVKEDKVEKTVTQPAAAVEEKRADNSNDGVQIAADDSAPTAGDDSATSGDASGDAAPAVEMPQ